MKKNVAGIFATSYEAMKAIDSLKHDGIDNEHIYVIANEDLKFHTIAEKTGINVKEDMEPTQEHETPWEEIKSFFTDTDKGKMKETDLSDLGMTKADVERYADKVKNGHVLVLVDNEADRGRTGILSTENMPGNNTANIKIHGEKVDNFTTGDRFDRDEHSPNARMPAQSGRPIERAEGLEMQERQREYEEEINPFENRFTSGYSGQNEYNRHNGQPDYGNNPS